MTKSTNYFVLLLVCLFTSLQTKAQTFIFPPQHTTPSCYDGSDYTLQTGLKITGVKVVQIYSDNGTTGSFAFEILFTYGNIFTGPVGNGSANFYTYQGTFYTDNPNISSNNITNNGSNIPLVTDTIGNMNLHNNPTYNGSASAMGLAVGTYTNQDTINMFGYDSASLVADAPCMSISAGANASIGSPLPIQQLSDFTANIKGYNVSLNWITRMERNNDGFRIEKSNDGKNWSTLTWVVSEAMNGNSNVPLYYDAEDNKPYDGTNFYRILQINKSGEKLYSKIVSVVNNSLKGSVLVYPNPATAMIHVSSKETFKNQVYTLYNLTGRMIYKDKATGNAFDIDMSRIPAGMYMLEIGTAKHKVILIH